jgi:hypothetical protein
MVPWAINIMPVKTLIGRGPYFISFSGKAVLLNFSIYNTSSNNNNDINIPEYHKERFAMCKPSILYNTIMKLGSDKTTKNARDICI